MVRVSAQVVRRTWLIAAGALVASSLGAFARGGDGPRTFVTLHGDEVELYGVGLYRADTTLVATGTRGTDVVTLLFEVPLLVLALRASAPMFAEGRS